MTFRILTISDIQGNLGSIQTLYDESVAKNQPIDIIIHTGNFGFWDSDTVDEYKDLAYLKQIIAFSEVIDSNLVEELNDLSLISNSVANQDEFGTFRAKLKDANLSQFDRFLSGELKFPCPVYTIYGPLDDPRIINKFHLGEYSIPNLFLVDHFNVYEVETPLKTQPNIRLYGLGGSLKIHSLFDNGNLNYSSISGKIGELWISMIQIAELYENISKSLTNDSSINIFLSHAPVIKTPLLEHLAIITNADFTISQGLHFRYPIMGNGMGFVDSMGGSAGYIENYRSKFSRLRMILGELWLIVREDLLELLEEGDHGLRNSIELGLSLFDKIPISSNDPIDKIVPLTIDEKGERDEENKRILRRINDLYFQAYYNLWHFNLCDHVSPSTSPEKEYNVMVFNLDSAGSFKLEYCTSQGFNFGFKLDQHDSGSRDKYEEYGGEYFYDDKEEEYPEAERSDDVRNSKYKPKFSAIEYSPKTGVKKQIIREKKDETEEDRENGDAIDDGDSNKEPSPLSDDAPRYLGKYPRGGLNNRGNGRGRGRGRGGYRGSGTRYRGRGKPSPFT